ncbi:MAG: hypothetical protein JKZ00_03820 [Flavobacteriaceae bacterium]|nr:hypothetical protein [Flavobacteriaceae bacterium]
MKNKVLNRSYPLLIFLFLSNISFSQEKIIKQGDLWLYYDAGYLKSNWAATTLNIANWKQGKTPIGYGDSKIITEISYGDNKAEKHITKYFKRMIILEDPLKYIAYELKFQRDDGIVLYLNGQEIYRDNLPDGVITGQTRASNIVQSSAESTYHSFVIDSKDFNVGENTISASVHQATQRSSDCIFNLELLGHDNPRVLSALVDEKTVTNFKLETRIRNLSNKFQLSNNAVQIDLLKNANNNYKFLIFLLSLLLVVAVVLAYFGISKYRKDNELANKKLLELNEVVFNKDREMMTTTTQLLHNKQYFKEIKVESNYLKTDNSSTVKSLIKQIDFVIEKDDEWEHLKKHFNTVYSGFYDVLIGLHPTLTEIELRHCMFIKLHMQTKEIARILHVDPRSVQASRYRIKKKMELDEDTDLRNYIIHVA